MSYEACMKPHSHCQGPFLVSRTLSRPVLSPSQGLWGLGGFRATGLRLKGCRLLGGDEPLSVVRNAVSLCAGFALASQASTCNVAQCLHEGFGESIWGSCCAYTRQVSRTLSLAIILQPNDLNPKPGKATASRFLVQKPSVDSAVCISLKQTCTSTYA